MALLLGLESLFLEETQDLTRLHVARDSKTPSSGTVSLRREECLFRTYALHRRGLPALGKFLRAQGGYLLHVDGTLTQGSPTVFVAWDEWSGLVLDARVIPSEDGTKIAEFFRDLEAALGRPCGLVSDMGLGILAAAKEVWPGIPLQLCHFHFVRDVGKDLFEKLEPELRHRLIATRVLARLGELDPGGKKDWRGSGRRCAAELEGALELGETRWMKILLDHVLGPRERASRFPFELTYASIGSHAWSSAPLAHELLMWNVKHEVMLISLVKAERLLGKLTKDPELTVMVRRLETLVRAFGEYREALGVGRDVTGSDREVASATAAADHSQVEEVLARWETIAEGIDNEVIRQGIREMREAWEKRQENLYVEVRDLHGKVRAIERTNWRSEQGHREVRLMTRGRTRKERTEQEMTRYGALETVLLNWGRPGYARAMGWEGLDIVRAMGTVTEKELEKARKLKGETNRCRSDIRKPAHRDPLLRELLKILRREGPEMAQEIRGWMARREPLRQPVV